MAVDLNKRDWRKLRNFISKVHNVHVKRALKSSVNKTNRQNSKLLEACLIDDNDSIPEALFKSVFFWLDLGYINERVQAIATLPEAWPKRVGADHPQLVIVFRPEGKKTSYQISVPHYNGDRNPKIPSYHKGSYRGEIVLTDNSKLVVNAVSEPEAIRVLKILRRYVDAKYLIGREATVAKVRGSGFKETRVKPIKADFYQHGQTEENRPNWRKYF